LPSTWRLTDAQPARGMRTTGNQKGLHTHVDKSLVGMDIARNIGAGRRGRTIGTHKETKWSTAASAPATSWTSRRREVSLEIVRPSWRSRPVCTDCHPVSAANTCRCRRSASVRRRRVWLCGWPHRSALSAQVSSCGMNVAKYQQKYQQTPSASLLPRETAQDPSGMKKPTVTRAWGIS